MNATVDLVALTERLSSWKPSLAAGPSLCLYGRSGTGKSEYVHHLARRMGRRVTVRRVSDIQDMWLGASERNIADAFAEAAREGTVLLFDEVDSFLRDRRGARHSWESTIVNELLQQLESFRGVFCCTTNLYADLDQAVLRRFTHKVEFLPLRPEQRWPLFESHLAPLLAVPLSDDERAAVQEALQRMSGLVPGDFAVIALRVRLEGGGARVADLLRALEAELGARGERRPVGFERDACRPSRADATGGRSI